MTLKVKLPAIIAKEIRCLLRDGPVADIILLLRSDE